MGLPLTIGANMEAKGLIFDIQAFSLHDGPGCRTTVFMKGCPLRCKWCANPEGLEERENVMYRESRCRGEKEVCLRCMNACRRSGITASGTGRPLRNRQICQECQTLECAEACLQEGMVACGRWLSVGELLKILQRDRQFWGPAGGVTFSGGEPLFQHEFLVSALKACQEAYVHTAVETSAWTSEEIFLKVMNYVDFVFVDIKHMDKDTHYQGTGVSNEPVLANLRRLHQSGWPGRLVIRLPVIPGFNDDSSNFQATAAFMQENGWNEINLLPFHPLGESKWRQWGEFYPYRQGVVPTETAMRQAAMIFSNAGIRVYLGSDTPF